MRKAILSMILSTCALPLAAQQPAEQQADSVLTIIDAIDMGGGTITIMQGRDLDRLVMRGDYKSEAASTSNGRQTGYRIQVFSDNNVRTAKANAEYRKRAVEQRLPGVRAYLTYEAPYWRVRVGDYRTRVEADAAMREIKNSFPAFASEVRLVRDRVNVSQ